MLREFLRSVLFVLAYLTAAVLLAHASGCSATTTAAWKTVGAKLARPAACCAECIAREFVRVPGQAEPAPLDGGAP